MHWKCLKTCKVQRCHRSTNETRGPTSGQVSQLALHVPFSVPDSLQYNKCFFFLFVFKTCTFDIRPECDRGVALFVRKGSYFMYESKIVGNLFSCIVSKRKHMVYSSVVK